MSQLAQQMSTAAPLFEPSGYGPCGAVQMSSAVLFRFCRINIKLNIYRTCFIEENYITIITVIVLSPSPTSKYICSCAPPCELLGRVPPRLGTTGLEDLIVCKNMRGPYLTPQKEWEFEIKIKCDQKNEYYYTKVWNNLFYKVFFVFERSILCSTKLHFSIYIYYLFNKYTLYCYNFDHINFVECK